MYVNNMNVHTLVQTKTYVRWIITSVSLDIYGEQRINSTGFVDPFIFI